MGKKLFIITILVLLSGWNQASTWTPKCYQFFYFSESKSADQLRAIGAECPEQGLANLYYNRARHADLVKFLEKKKAQETTRTDLDRYIESYRINIALLETFSLNGNTNFSALVNTINEGYINAMTEVRLRISGYEKLVQWINWNRSLTGKHNPKEQVSR